MSAPLVELLESACGDLECSEVSNLGRCATTVPEYSEAKVLTVFSAGNFVMSSLVSIGALSSL